MAAPKRKPVGADMVIAFGGGDHHHDEPDGDEMDNSPDEGADDMGEGDTEYSAEFETAATDAFPELEGKPDRIKALYDAIMACK
jgi:hypothetical protein